MSTEPTWRLHQRLGLAFKTRVDPSRRRPDARRLAAVCLIASSPADALRRAPMNSINRLGVVLGGVCAALAVAAAMLVVTLTSAPDPVAHAAPPSDPATATPIDGPTASSTDGPLVIYVKFPPPTSAPAAVPVSGTGAGRSRANPTPQPTATPRPPEPPRSPTPTPRPRRSPTPRPSGTFGDD